MSKITRIFKGAFLALAVALVLLGAAGPSAARDIAPQQMIGAGLQFTDDFYLRVGMGVEPGYSFIEKFGENEDVDTASAADIWDGGATARGGQTYTWSTTAAIDTISSSDAADTETITIVGQTVDGVEVFQDVTLNGQSKVTLSTPLWRAYRMFVKPGTVGSPASDIVGEVALYEDTAISAGVPTDRTKVRAMIVDGNNQTLMCIYTIPAGKMGFFLGGYIASTRVGNNEAVLTWRARAPYGVFAVQSKLALIGAGSSTWQYNYPVPVGPLPAGTDIKIRVEEVGANNTGLAGGFTVLLKDMENGVPTVTACPADEWTLVATAVKYGQVRHDIQGNYIFKYVPTGDPKPTDEVGAGVAHDGIMIGHNATIDVYIKSRGAAGQVSVDL